MSEILDKKTLKALSSETRQEIIKHLSKRPYTASELAKITKRHVTTITEHLDTLEKSGLVQKKEDGHKWIYYQLSGKGEKLFKPAYYSWVVVLSLSLIALMIGTQQFLHIQTSQIMAKEFVSEVAGKSAMAATEAVTAQQPITAVNYSFFIGSVFVLLAVAGFTFLVIRWYKYYRMLR